MLQNPITLETLVSKLKETSRNQLFFVTGPVGSGVVTLTKEACHMGEIEVEEIRFNAMDDMDLKALVSNGPTDKNLIIVGASGREAEVMAATILSLSNNIIATDIDMTGEFTEFAVFESPTIFA